MKLFISLCLVALISREVQARGIQIRDEPPVPPTTGGKLPPTTGDLLPKKGASPVAAPVTGNTNNSKVIMLYHILFIIF
jgi:hypothetical protein